MTKRQNKIVRLTEDILNEPHLISQKSFNVILQYLDNRNNGLLMQPMSDPNEPEDDSDSYDPMSGVGVIDICGSLTNMPIQTMCGTVGCSYQNILEDAEEMLDSGCHTIVMNVDSGGGEAFNCFCTAKELRNMCDEAGCDLIAYVQSCSASAAYALTVVADEVVCHPDGEVGSIGVLVSMRNYAKAMEMDGIQQVYVFAGDNKVPFAEDGSFKDSFIQTLQGKVDGLYTEFVQHVSDYTGISTQDVRDTQASMFGAKEALSKGMINKIMDNAEFAKYMVSRQGALDA